MAHQHGPPPPGEARDSVEAPRYSLDVRSALVSDGFTSPSFGSEELPPPYGELHNQLQFTQPGFEAGANVTEDGRVDININQKNSRLSELLGATLRSQGPIAAEQGPLAPAYIPPTLGGGPGQVPPPKLNLVVQIVGSRGDVQPFVALGKVLKDTYGHRVRIATHPVFQKFVEENGLEFFSIGGDPSELMAFMVKHPGLMPGIDALKTGEVSKRRKGMREILLGCWRSCIEPGNGLGPGLQPHKKDEPLDLESEMALPGDPSSKPFIADAIIANPPSFAHIHIAEKLGIPLHMMFTMPWSPTRAFPHPLANITASNTDDVMTSYLSYTLVEMMTWQGLGDVINRFRTKILDLEPLSMFWAPGLLTRLRIPYTYCWSPSLIPKPNDWQNNIDISGFFFLDLATSYTPDPELAAFLEAGPPPVYIGFGSIVVEDPNALTRMIFDAVHISGVRALVSQGWGGLGAEDVGLPPGVFMIGNCPHDWLFQHVSAVVHHGGAGTMAAGVRAGKPTVIIPFFGDQPFWGAMIDRAGAGPTPIPFKDLTAENLAEAITKALKPEVAERAQELGQQIRNEQGTDVGGKSFHDHLDVQSLRCSVSPSRVAVWRVRRTQVRLSSFAAAVLVNQGLITYTDLKLWRARDYNTDGQPWDPISAATASLVTDLSDIALAIADFPRGMFGGSKKESKNKEPKESKDKESTGSDSQTATSRKLSDILSSLSRSNNNFSRTTFATSTSGSTAPRSAEHLETIDQPEIAELPVEEAGRQPKLADSVVAGVVELPLEADPQAPPTPSVTITSEKDSRTSTREAGLTPPSTEDQRPGLSGSRTHSRAGSHSGSPSHGETPYKLDIEDFRGASSSVRKVVSTGVKSPMNFCLGLAKGFRNVPRLYNDDTVRPQEKVTGLASGLRVAGKEFGFGLYDGISGLVTQPIKGAQKDGGMGLVKGFGRGIGGIVMKPAAAMWSLPAYAMQGAYMEVRSHFAKSVENHISTSRIIMGEEERSNARHEEIAEVLAQWGRIGFDLKGFHALKLKEAKDAKQTGGAGSLFAVDRPQSTPDSMAQFEPSGRRALRGKDSWKRSHIDVKIDPQRQPEIYADDEFESAIQASVRETSRGNAQEDAQVERAIRESVQNLQRSGQPLPSPQPREHVGSSSSTAEDLDLQITDEEYQELIEQAIRQSMALQAARLPDGGANGGGSGGVDVDEEFHRALERSRTDVTLAEEEHDEDLRRAIEESKIAPPLPPRRAEERDLDLERAIEESRAAPPPPPPREGDDDEDEELRKAIEASERMDREREDRDKAAKTEEEIVLEYVLRQSRKEEEYRRARAGLSAGVDSEEAVASGVDAGEAATKEAPAGPATAKDGQGHGKGKERQEEQEEEEDYEEDAEELKRALEMSMKVNEEWSGSGAGAGAGPGPSVHGRD